MALRELTLTGLLTWVEPNAARPRLGRRAASPGRGGAVETDAQEVDQDTAPARNIVQTRFRDVGEVGRARLAGENGGGPYDGLSLVRFSASLIAQAALASPMWLNACGKLPSSSPVAGSISSASSPTSLT